MLYEDWDKKHDGELRATLRGRVYLLLVAWTALILFTAVQAAASSRLASQPATSRLGLVLMENLGLMGMQGFLDWAEIRHAWWVGVKCMDLLLDLLLSLIRAIAMF